MSQTARINQKRSVRGAVLVSDDGAGAEEEMCSGVTRGEFTKVSRGQYVATLRAGQFADVNSHLRSTFLKIAIFTVFLSFDLKIRSPSCDGTRIFPPLTNFPHLTAPEHLHVSAFQHNV